MAAPTVNNFNDSSQQVFEPLDVLFDRIDERFFAQVADLRLMPEWTPPAGQDGGHFFNPRDGGSMEFKQHRGYAPGDDVRRVDWAVYGRTQKLFTRVVEAEHTPELVIAVDCSASMEANRASGKFGRALELALLLAYVALKSDYRVQLVPLGHYHRTRRVKAFGWSIPARFSAWRNRVCWPGVLKVRPTSGV